MDIQGPVRAAKILARTIESVHMRAPYSWELSLFENMWRLNAGQDAVAEVLPGVLCLYCLGRQRAMPVGFEREDVGSYDDVEGVVERWLIDADSLNLVPESFLRAHLALVAAASDAKQRSPWKYAHSPSGVDAIGAAAGRTLAQRDYAKEHLVADHSDSGAADGRSFGAPNPEIERIAVATATRYYTARGWKVKSVERDGCGFDLLCRKGSKSLHVEVKGLSGPADRFVMTAKEMHRANEDPHFALVICSQTSTVSSDLRILRGNSLLKEYLANPTAYVLSRRT